MTDGIHSKNSLLLKKMVPPSRPQLQTPTAHGLGSSGEGRKGPVSPRAIDEQCINTIRTLAMDAVQQAKSGHPGTPMALAPVAYTLWQNFLRFNPDDPIWPNRDRFVLSNGHASMLLYALLHLCGVKAVNAKYERLDEPAVTLDDIKRFRQLDSKCPGHPEYHLTSGVETTTGPARSRLRQQRRHGARRALAGKAFQPTRLRDVRLRRVRHMRRRRHDGGRIERSGLARRSPDARQPLLDLRQQPDHHRRPYRIWLSATMSRRASWPMAGTCSGSATPTIRERLAQAIEIFRRTDDVPTLIIVESHIGYGAPHKHDTSAAHGEPLGEEEIRLAKRSYGWPEDAKFLVPDGVREHFQDGIGRRGRSLQEDWSALFKSYRKKYPDLADQDRAHAAARASRWLGRRLFRLSRPTRRALPRATPPARCSTPSPSHYPWLIGGAADLAPSTKTHLDIRRCRRSRSRHAGRPQHALRHPRACDGRDPERARTVQGPALRRGLPDLLRLHEAADPPCRADGAAGHLCLHARLDRRGRGRTDAPAGRAARRFAQHSGTHHAPSRRRQRGRRSVARHHRSPAPAGLSGAEPPGAADVRPHALRAGRGRGPRRLRSRRRAGQQAGGDPDRHRQRGALCVDAFEELKQRRHSGTRRQHAVMGAVRAAGSDVPRQRAATERHGARIGRDGLGDRLGPLCRPDRRQDRHAYIRLLGAAQGPAHQVRLHAGQGACRREGADREVQRNDTMNVQVKTKTSVNPLRLLHDHGQAVWLDFLSRRFIAEGGLKKLIDQDGLTGVTSNPSIFEKAIARQRGLRFVAEDSRKCRRLRCDGALRAARDRGHPACRGRAAPGLRRDRTQGRIRQPRSLALSGDEHRRDGRRGAAALARGRPRQPDDQGAGDQGRPARDPPTHRRRHQRQHHAAVLAASL